MCKTTTLVFSEKQDKVGLSLMDTVLCAYVFLTVISRFENIRKQDILDTSWRKCWLRPWGNDTLERLQVCRVPLKMFLFLSFPSLPPHFLCDPETRPSASILPAVPILQETKTASRSPEGKARKSCWKNCFFFFFFFKGMPINAQTQLAFISPTLKRIKEKILQFNGQPLVLYVCLSTLWVESRNF